MKKLNRCTVTVGIPAFNEEANIGFLLQDLLKQREENFHLRQIIIYSDGSTDRTVEIVRSILDKRIIVIENKKRKGPAVGQNEIFKKANTDALVLLNADIKIRDPYFIEKLIQPIREKKADLSSPKPKELQARNMFEEIIFISMKLKTYIFEHYRNGNNIYTCHGQARAFSKKLYKSITFTISVGEDAYSYFFCKTHNFRYAYVKQAQILYKLPDNMQDHQKQSVRFFQSQRELADIFGKDYVNSEYQLPKSLILQGIMHTFLTYPLQTAGYAALVIYMKIKAAFFGEPRNIWEISKSSKSLHFDK